VVWVDSDPFASSGENSLPDLRGVGLDYTTYMMTATKNFTSSADFFWHYVSNVALVNGSNYNIGVTNSIDRAGNGDVLGTFDHYFYNGCTFADNEFIRPMPNVSGIQEQTASFGTFTTYPNPARDLVSVNLNMNQSGNVNFTIVNELGQAVLIENRFLASGSNLVQLNTSALASGVYFITVASENDKATSKIVIQ
jgi:hypothetical protein